MSRRDHPERRCATCRMHQALCICSFVPRLETRARLVLVIHRDEERKPTNTGSLAARALVNSTTVIVGDPARPAPLPLIHDDEQGILLFPADDARPLPEVATGDRPFALVVPDGNWRQGAKVRGRMPGVKELPCAILPPGPMTTYRLRTETKDGGLATLEAIARAFRILEGPERGPLVEEALLKVFRVMVDRSLWMRGALRDDEVEGGIPDAAKQGVRG